MNSRSATLMVFVTSALVLVLEILAGRLVAPYVGVSLESFTGIIGTMLAGIAVGSAFGGRVADGRDPRTLLGPTLVLGGVLSWVSVPIVVLVGPLVGPSPIEIVGLTTVAFFLPAAVLSAISPMVAKLALGSLEETGTVVGGLSASGTTGALVGTFLTGFVLVAVAPVRLIIAVLGAALVILGVVVGWKYRNGRPGAASVLGVLVGGLALAGVPSTCDYDTEYFCARIEVDEERPTGRSLYLDRLRHAYVDLDDPTHLEFRYMRLLADVAEAQPEGPLDVLYLGGGGFSLPRWMTVVRPGSTNEILEIDGELVDIAETEFGLSPSDGLNITIGDARLALGGLETDSFDFIVGDVFAGGSVPWHLTTAEVVAELERVLRPEGTYVMNVIDGGSSDYARAQLATLGERFDHLAAIVPPPELGLERSYNQILVASPEPILRVDVDRADGVVVSGAALDAFVGDARVLTDDFAPVDQLSE